MLNKTISLHNKTAFIKAISRAREVVKTMKGEHVPVRLDTDGNRMLTPLVGGRKERDLEGGYNEARSRRIREEPVGRHVMALMRSFSRRGRLRA